MQILLKSFLAFILVTSTIVTTGQTKPSKFTDIPALTAGLQKYQKALGNDFVVIVHKNGKEVYKREFGELKAGSQEAVGAASQWLTAALVMTFVDEGKLRLDDRVGDFLPVMESYSKGYITIRQCLSHTTAIETDMPVFRSALKKKKFDTLEDEVKSIAKDRNMKGKQGTQFYYGNLGPNIAGQVLEVISKKNFDRLFRDRLGKALGLRRTTFMSDGVYAENPSAGAKSSADDYIKFLTMLMNNGMYNGKQVLSEKSVNEIFRMQTGAAKIVYTSPLSQGNAYGLGCWLQEKDEQGNGILVNCPGISGTWPWIHRGKGYSAIIFTKGEMPDQQRVVFEEIRNLIEESIQ
ncbi:serine hydrolase domain-containing protein [Flavihumibacter fluvii]|uniref:serine hydrolase domain-containing protein n=1 Tax=Flavihumibacter fluvii TaxID=2838157 RepID=UPI001BDE1497|nr:serine hydrolase domain-containing protein [Flavihumibacter fluvii]ULQ53715.1 beta-lactamase family protein [Flavihumibacter fluvii]